MRGRTVVTPDGRTWVVRRRWMPRLGAESLPARFHRRFRQTMRRAGDVADVDPGCLEVIGEGFVAAIAIVVAVVVIIFVVVPLAVALLDVVIVALLAVVGLGGRVLFRRPWTIEARASDGARLQWHIVGWRASGERISEVADLLTAGVHPHGAERVGG